MELYQPFKRQPHKMVKHTQTIRLQKPTNCLSVSDHFEGMPHLPRIFVINIYISNNQAQIWFEIL